MRVRARALPVDTHFDPHRHAWAQLAYSASGMLRVVAARGPGEDEEVTFIVPPSRAVWIAPGVRHAVHALEAAAFRTLYLDASVTPVGWSRCRMIEVSPLLRELIPALDGADAPSSREAAIVRLVLDELTHADTLPIGVPLSHPERGDKRLRAMCQSVLHNPGERATLAQWAADAGASERTMARLFRAELGMSYPQWRQQVVLAHALPRLARGETVGQVAQDLGYRSESAFSAMFHQAMGMPPRQLRARRAQ